MNEIRWAETTSRLVALMGEARRVPFDDVDREVALWCAEKRLWDAKAMNMKDHFGQDSLLSHYHGALGEIGLSRYLGVPFTCPSGAGSVPDVAGYEVRAVGPGTRLYIKTKENDKADRVASVALAPDEASCIICGWMWARDIRRLGRYSDPGRRGAPAWMLYDMSHLILTFPEKRLSPLVQW